ncbi:hypothetical protein DVK02_08535 [Halobellus sp. Atlit-31R]|nr:hypothetical protein DVK02_08535 [Halobellus sp. Atlit-31R]
MSTSTCYVASRAGVLVARDASRGTDADSVRSVSGPALTGRTVECLDAASAAPSRVFCGTLDAGLYRSVDGGRGWRRIGEATLPASVTSVTVSPHDPTVVYAGTEPSGVYRTTDGGDTWTELPGLTDLPSASRWSFPPRPDTHHVRWIAVDPADPDHLYVAVEAGALIQTHDGGETWTQQTPQPRRDTHTIAIHPDAPDRVRVAAGDGYAESDDGGQTWQYPQDGLEHRYCWSVAVDPGDPDRVLLSAASGARRAHRPASAASYLYRRERAADAANATDERSAVGTTDATDATDTANGPTVRWERLDDVGVPTGEGALRATLASGVADGELFALTDRGLFRTADGGDTFGRVHVAWPDAFRATTTRGLAVVASAT